MNDDELEALNDVEKIREVAKDLRKRFKMINEVMMNYGSISNDDLIGLIAKLIPPDCQE